MHKRLVRLFSAFSLPLLHSRAVTKVGKPRSGHPLVDFVIVGKTDRKNNIGPGVCKTCACSCIHERIKG